MNLYHVCCQSLFRGHVTSIRAFSANQVHRSVPRVITAKDALQDVTNDDNTKQIHTSIQSKIKEASTPQDLLVMVSDPGFNSTHACSSLKYLGDFVKKDQIDPKVLASNNLYLETCRKVMSHIDKTPAFSLLLALQGLYKIDKNSQRDMISLVQNNLVHTSRLINMRPLISLFLLQQANANTASDKKLLRTVSINLQRRWVEIQNTDDILALLSSNVEHFPKKFLDQLEDLLLEKVPSMTTTQQIGTLTALGKLRHRHLPMLRALMFHLSSAECELSLSQVTSALYSCSVLTLYLDPTFTEKIAKDLIRVIPLAHKPDKITALNTSIGILRWRNADVLDAIEQWIIKNGDKVGKREATAYIMAAASIHHTPHDNIIPVIESALSSGAPDEMNEGWLVDVVWAYTVLRINNTLLPKLLNTDIKVHALSTGRRLKLQQIIQSAQVEGLKIPNILEEAAIKQDEVPRSKDATNLSEMTLAALRAFVPTPKYLREKITLPNGIFIDAEFAVEGEPHYKPVPLDTWYKPHEVTLPKQCSRIAVCVWDYKCTVLESEDLAGHSSLTAHLLSRLGYRVLHVTHTELSREDKDAMRVQLLQRKLNNLLADG